jgi:CheY-like chemotaxis protein
MTAELKTPERSEVTGLANRRGLRKPGILIADDMGLILALLKLELEPRGFSVWLAEDGDDALDVYRRHHEAIDMVLLDVQMPGRDGPHTLAALQEVDPGVLACFMTGNAATYTEEELLDWGAVYVFDKPFRPAEVAHLLQILVSASQDSTPLSPAPRRTG